MRVSPRYVFIGSFPTRKRCFGRHVVLYLQPSWCTLRVVVARLATVVVFVPSEFAFVTCRKCKHVVGVGVTISAMVKTPCVEPPKYNP